jgi:steroid 5-alpha reductase family enzyme
MTILFLVEAILVIAAALSVIMAGAWLIWRRTGNAGWIDTTWTFGLGAVGIAAALCPLPQSAAPNARQAILAALFAAWAVRLGVHIAGRTAAITDDPRYARLAQDWAAAAPRRMFVFLQQQALGSVPLALAIFIAAQVPVPQLRLQDFVGFAILALGIVGETIADSQLRDFKSDPANGGRILDTGLWRYSRHPNYFFQWLGWLAWPAIAIDLSGTYPYGWLAAIGPAVMYWVLRHATGVPHLERHMERTRGDAFRAHQARVNVFFPGRRRS